MSMDESAGVSDPHRVEVTEDDVARFVETHWVHQTCPRCEHNNWRSGVPDTMKAMLPIASDGTLSIMQTKHHLPFYWLICAVCGHVELIGAKVVQEWKRHGRKDSPSRD